MTLNIWGGHVRGPLLEFIHSNRKVDILCLQEVYDNAQKKISTEDRAVSLSIFSEMAILLPEHRSFFRPVVNNVYGIAIFVRKEIEVLGEGAIRIHENLAYPGRGPTHSRDLQWIQCRLNQRTYCIMNVHGLWNGKGKTDSPERIEQSKRIRDAMCRFDSPQILCGDFNLRPDTESMNILENGMDNLNKKFNIKSTRTSFYPKEEKFADYVLTSSEITVNSFGVLPDQVSDHAPLLLDFV
jgi:endonuclease/exonuclease/phosphatase family metal-dependent hydrolase